MKTRVLIIIGIIIAIIIAITISVSALIIIDYIEAQSKTSQIENSSFNPPSVLSILHALSVADKEELQKVLDDCASSEEPEFGLVYSNDTHYIGNRDCMWEPRNSLSDRTRSYYDPHIPYELKLVLDDCGARFYEPDIKLVFTNSTHQINNVDCEWETPPKGNFTSFPVEELQRVLDHCEYQKKFTAGEIPERVADGSYNGIDAIGLSFQNSTHYIDNNTCEWEYALTEEQIHDRIDVVFGNALQSWTAFPGGVGYQLPKDSTLTGIYKEGILGMSTLDFEAMLNDTIFVDRCISNDGVWNDFYYDCEGLDWICEEVGGIGIQVDLKKSPCVDTGIIDDDPLTIKVCRGSQPVRLSCVFEYEN